MVPFHERAICLHGELKQLFGALSQPSALAASCPGVIEVPRKQPHHERARARSGDGYPRTRKHWRHPEPKGVGDAECTVTGKTNTRLGMSFLSKSLVLIVDHDPAISRGMQRLLRQFGYDALLFATADALKNHTDFANVVCVILDLDLKDGLGIELGLRLKATGISVPVIYTTARDNPAGRMAALQSGYLAILTKPFSAQSLIELLKIASAEPI